MTNTLGEIATVQVEPESIVATVIQLPELFSPRAKHFVIDGQENPSMTVTVVGIASVVQVAPESVVRRACYFRCSFLDAPRTIRARRVLHNS
ncbi:MAG: hypothetical protein HKL80_12340 [Acidimicrobiales bacterium]|nr:hypothetical protein [Acidimicrobiales bacterium]